MSQYRHFRDLLESVQGFKVECNTNEEKDLVCTVGATVNVNKAAEKLGQYLIEEKLDQYMSSEEHFQQLDVKLPPQVGRRR